MKVGAIAYKKTKKGVKICLVTSRRHTGTLTLPKGHAKQNEVMAKAALRELFEEAGVVGKIIKKSRPILYTCSHDLRARLDCRLQAERNHAKEATTTM